MSSRDVRDLSDLCIRHHIVPVAQRELSNIMHELYFVNGSPAVALVFGLWCCCDSDAVPNQLPSPCRCTATQLRLRPHTLQRNHCTHTLMHLPIFQAFPTIAQEITDPAIFRLQPLPVLATQLCTLPDQAMAWPSPHSRRRSLYHHPRNPPAPR